MMNNKFDTGRRSNPPISVGDCSKSTMNILFFYLATKNITVYLLQLITEYLENFYFVGSA